MTAALIMAGGQSARMRKSGNACHKSLRTVGEVPLIERNLLQVLASGISSVFVAINAREDDLRSFVQRRGTELAAATGATIQCLVEEHPRGTIGIAYELANLATNVLVVNVDNLTTISLRSMIEQHQSQDAAMTIATHVEDFRVPLGEVVIQDDQIVEYREKPNHPVRISSGAYVLAARTCSWICPHQRTDIPSLIPMLRKKNELVLAYEHDAHWIDINDAETLLRAEELVAKYPEEFNHDQSWLAQGLVTPNE